MWRSRIGGVSRCLVACLLLLAACEPQGLEEGLLLVAKGSPRYARLALPFDPEWKPESTDHIRKPTSPNMVIWEVSEFAPEMLPTPEHKAAASDLIERCFKSAERHGWFDFEKGRADGYWRPRNDIFHFRNTEYLLDDVVLDPERPEVLMYYPTPEGRKLAGFMFMAKSRFDRGPQLAGPLSIWHYHVWRGKQCVVDAVTPVGVFPPNTPCPRGVGYSRSFEMMHVWLIDHPGGPFGTGMVLPNEVYLSGFTKRMEERGY